MSGSAAALPVLLFVFVFLIISSVIGWLMTGNPLIGVFTLAVLIALGIAASLLPVLSRQRSS